MDELDVVQACFSGSECQVIDLSADHAARSDRASQTRPDRGACRGVGQPGALRKRLGEESTSGQNGRGVVEGNMGRRLSPADGVVILGWQVIENERRGVDQLHGARNRHGPLQIRSRGYDSAERQRRTQALAAREHGIAHGLVQLHGGLRRGR